MKRLIFALFFVFTFFKVNSQELLKLSVNGFNATVISVDGLNASDLYRNSLKWVHSTYKNPDLVLKTKIENEKIRIDGHMSDAWYYSSMGIKNYYGMDYTLELSFKDGRYKIDFLINRFTDKGATAMHKLSHFYKEDGTIRKMYSDSPISLEESVNILVSSLQKYIKSGGVNNEDW